MVDSTNPRIMADNIRQLSDKQIAEAAEIVALLGDVAALGSYSATEVDTGMKLGDSNIYRKIIEVESFPNNTTVNIQHNIANLDKMLLCYGIVYHNPGVDSGRMFVGSTTPGVTFSAAYLYLKTTTDMSNMAGCIVLEYTKSATPTPDVIPSPDPDTRTLEEPEPEPEPIEEKK